MERVHYPPIFFLFVFCGGWLPNATSPPVIENQRCTVTVGPGVEWSLTCRQNFISGTQPLCFLASIFSTLLSWKCSLSIAVNVLPCGTWGLTDNIVFFRFKGGILFYKVHLFTNKSLLEVFTNSHFPAHSGLLLSMLFTVLLVKWLWHAYLKAMMKTVGNHFKSF